MYKFKLIVSSCLTKTLISLKLHLYSAPITTGMILVFIFYNLSNSTLKSLYLDIFSSSISATLLSAGMEMSTRVTNLAVLSMIVISGHLALIILSQ